MQKFMFILDLVVRRRRRRRIRKVRSQKTNG